MLRFDDAVRHELRENWPALLVAFCCLLFGFSAPAFALPFLFTEVINEFGWTREQATLLASTKYLTGAVAAMMVGRFIDVTGVRIALLLTIGTGAVAMVSFLWVSNLTFYYMCGVLLGFSGPGTMVAVKVMVSRTFHASQGTAMGLALLGTSVGSIVVPLIISALIGGYGWRYGMASLSLGVWLIAIPMLFLNFFTRSINRSQADRPVLDKATAKAERKAAGQASGKALALLMRKREFWLIGAAVFLAAVVDQGFIQHQVLIFTDLELPREIVALGISAMGGIGIACRVLIGNFLDAKSVKGAALLYCLLTLSSLLAFMLGNPLIFFAFIVMRAAGHAAVLLDTTVLTKHVFGLKNYGTLIGIYTAFVSLGFAAGAWLMGRLYDIAGNYNLAFALFAALPLIAAVLVWFIKPEFWTPPARKRADFSKPESV
ncbi:MAG: MFS transporter [Bordetella sp.]|nr:MFS transporter [Bordetella sp.]